MTDHITSRAAGTCAPPRSSLLFDIQNLNVGFRTPRGYKHIVNNFNLKLHPGETVAIVGESGSGKTVATRSLIGLAGDNAVVTADRLRFGDIDLLRASASDLKALRGAQVGYVLQDALVSLDPLQPIRNEIAEPFRAHTNLPRPAIAERIIRLLEDVGVPQPEVRKDQYPHELSGGLRQRALIASALALHPPVIIADEPTTALDVLVQAQVLSVLAKLIGQGTSIILISHDLAVVARLADRILVMKGGEVLESGSADEVLGAPRHDYTKALIQAVPSSHTKGRRLSVTAPAPKPALRSVAHESGRDRHEEDEAIPPTLLQAINISKSFRGPDNIARKAVDAVSLHLAKGEVLGIVGASGSGKSTVARILLALTDYDEGSILYRGIEWPKADDRTKRWVRSRISIVYQDPYSSFDPRWNVEQILGDALRLHARGRKIARADIVALLREVGLNETHLRARPINLSGGQRQRVAIARALAVNPEILILDEAVSALDVTIQAQILDLLGELKQHHALSIIFISHDLGVIHHIADRVLVMKDGAVVEEGPADAVFNTPRHSYTRELVASLPRLEHARLPVAAASA